ncbi:FTR1 family protein [Leptolyngbya cf. ectocarpi LEGE 11479]|uniref:FTR1 family protein n=1 Tax=Leptolyngbya cf. ectocarpi LEGE 11479 TaxID=1828722 RepID=A0A928WZV4_LEPEC|nr:FTR1 family protein [Leptolyngbya ectocarpi]MBE9065345.1 FTR1 family protein [Leptolyngbya cf. ectocarpi LEGE 11479]
MNIAPALPMAIVTLREGVEAALVVGIVLACLNKAEKTELNQWALGGVAAGVLGSILIGSFLGLGLQQLQHVMPNAQALFKPILGILFGSIAIIMLSWMLLWMTHQARSLKTDIGQTVNTAITSEAAGMSIFSLVCIAVLREGFETVLFLFTQTQTLAVSLGGVVIGLLGAVLIGFGLFKWGIRINLKLFFQVMGVLLLLIISGLVISVCRNMDITFAAFSKFNSLDLCLGFGQSCVLGPMIWDASRFMPDKQFPGVILKILLGYRDRIYLVQILAYGLFWLVIGNRYFRSLNQPQKDKNDQAVSTSA